MKESVVEEVGYIGLLPDEPKDEHTQHYTGSALPVADWPTSPETLGDTDAESMLLLLLDLALIAIPVALIIKVGLVIHAWRHDSAADGVDVDQYIGLLTKNLIKFNGQLVTLFTIVFMTIVSTLVRRYALWKAQKGAFVSELEQLHGSISLVSTIRLIWSLRAFTATSVGLVIVWTFYYLGSQASKLEYQLVNSDPFREQSGFVIQPGAVSAFSSNYTQNHVIDPGQIQSVYTTVTKAEDTHNVGLSSGEGMGYTIGRGRNPPPFRGFDPDGFAVLPLLDSFPYQTPGVKPKTDKQGWMDGTQFSSYTSLVGYPIWTNNTRTIYSQPDRWHFSTTQILGSYEVRTSYINISCGAPSLQSFYAFPTGTMYNQSMTINATRILQPVVLDSKGDALRVFDVWIRWSPDEINGQAPAESVRWTCNTTQIYADMKVGCSAAGCKVEKVRLANNSATQAISYNTPLNDEALASDLFDTMLLYPAAQQDLSRPSTMVNKITYQLRKFMSTDDQGNSTLGSVNHEYMYVLTNRVNEVLTRYINTFYMLSQIGFSDQRPHIYTDVDNEVDSNYQRTRLNAAIYSPHYAILWHWIAIDLISCMILLVASIAAMILRMRTIAPDVLGSVSSMTRDNPYLQLPGSGSALSGLERSRMLRNVKVKLGNVGGHQYDQGVGRIGLARVDSTYSEETLRVERLRKGMKYI